MGDCDKLKKYVSDYVEGQLDPSTRKQFEEELKISHELRKLTEKVSNVSRLLKNLTAYECKEDFSIRLRERIYNEPQKNWVSVNFRRYSFAFSFIVVIGITIFVLNKRIDENAPAQFIPSKNEISSDNDIYSEESIDVKTRDQQAVAVDSNNTRLKEKKDPLIKYVDQKK